MNRGLLLVGHGSHLSPHSSAPIHAHARALREQGRFDEVRVGFWKEEPSLSRALDGFRSADVTIVPVFISGGYFTNEVIPREMRITGPVSSIDGRTVRYTPPVGCHPSLARVIVQRALEAGATSADALAVLGHGTPRNPASEKNVFEQADHVRVLGGFPEVTTVFLDQQPNMRDIFDIVKNDSVVMVPLFIADGWHVGETIPEDLSIEGGEVRKGGRRLRYAGAVGTHPAIASVIVDLVEEAARW